MPPSPTSHGVKEIGPIELLLGGASCISFKTPDSDDTWENLDVAGKVWLCALMNVHEGFVLAYPQDMANCLLDEGLSDDNPAVREILEIIPHDICWPPHENISTAEDLIRESPLFKRELVICIESGTHKNKNYYICPVHNRTKEEFGQSEALEFYRKNCGDLPEDITKVSVLNYHQECVPQPDTDLTDDLTPDIKENYMGVVMYVFYGIAGKILL